jgi:5'-methylthioadenosine phosphorylase
MITGIIGGSGLYDIGLTEVEEIDIKTPFGQPSDTFRRGKLEGQEVIFLARHGQGHKLLPHELNHRANIWAMKKLGVESIVSMSAVGSLREDMVPLDFVIVDQYVDHLRRQDLTFYGDGAIAHISLADPACASLQKQAYNAADQLLTSETGTAKAHSKGTYINMQGPAFSTKAESKLYRQWGMDIIGMTNFGEAKLAREAEICYVTVAMVTDYDCWHPEHDAVTIEEVIDNLNKNANHAKNFLKKLLPNLNHNCTHGCRSALKTGLMSPLEMIPDATKEKLAPILKKYL